MCTPEIRTVSNHVTVAACDGCDFSGLVIAATDLSIAALQRDHDDHARSAA